jgi:DNA-binding transcriptional ArsR family regulator
MKASMPTRTLAVHPAAMAQLQDRAQEAAGLLKALANPDRLLVLCHLLDAERTVAELGDITRIVQPTLSQQLAVLRAEDLVTTRREGKHIHYRVASPAVRAVLRTLYKLYCVPGQAATH